MATIGYGHYRPRRSASTLRSKNTTSSARTVSVTTPLGDEGRPISLIFGLNRHRVRGGSEGDRLIAEGTDFQAAKCRDDFTSQVDRMRAPVEIEGEEIFITPILRSIAE